MSLYSTARSIFVALQDDEKAISAIRDERKTLALSLATHETNTSDEVRDLSQLKFFRTKDGGAIAFPVRWTM